MLFLFCKQTICLRRGLPKKGPYCIEEGFFIEAILVWREGGRAGACVRGTGQCDSLGTCTPGCTPCSPQLMRIQARKATMCSCCSNCEWAQGMGSSTTRVFLTDRCGLPRSHSLVRGVRSHQRWHIHCRRACPCLRSGSCSRNAPKRRQRCGVRSCIPDS